MVHLVMYKGTEQNPRPSAWGNESCILPVHNNVLFLTSATVDDTALYLPSHCFCDKSHPKYTETKRDPVQLRNQQDT